LELIHSFVNLAWLAIVNGGYSLSLVIQFGITLLWSGVSNVDKYGRLSQPSWLLGAL